MSFITLLQVFDLSKMDSPVIVLQTTKPIRNVRCSQFFFGVQWGAPPSLETLPFLRLLPPACSGKGMRNK